MPIFSRLHNLLHSTTPNTPVTPSVTPVVPPTPNTVPVVIPTTPTVQPANTHPLLQAVLSEIVSLFSSSPTASTPTGSNILSVLASAVNNPTVLSLLESVLNSSTANGQTASAESVINEIGVLFEQLMGQPTTPTTGS